MLVLAFMTLSALGVNAYAQEQERIIGNIPFQFVVAGETLPAGTYTVKIVASGSELVIASWDKSVFVLPTTLDSAPADKPLFTFDKVGDTYLLRQINTPVGTFSIGTSREVTKLAQIKPAASMNSSGTH